ncbi:hypothetical protein FF2_018464 [Malus domestica]
MDTRFITSITPANEAVLVTTSDITSLKDADRVIGLLECDKIRDIKMMMLGLALLGMISEDTEVIISTNRGYPLVLNRPPTLAGLAFEQAAWRLVEQDNMQAVMVEEEPKKRGFFLLFRKASTSATSRMRGVVQWVIGADGVNFRVEDRHKIIICHLPKEKEKQNEQDNITDNENGKNVLEKEDPILKKSETQ